KNPVISLELARRIVEIRIASGSERPEQRTGFKHEIRTWVESHHAELVWAACILVRSWVAVEMPKSEQRRGSFEQYCAVIGGILEHHGLDTEFLSTRAAYNRPDEDAASLQAFIALWWKERKSDKVSVSDLLSIAFRTIAPGDDRDAGHGHRIKLGK